MDNGVVIKLVDQQLTITGKIDFANAATIYNDGLKIIQKNQNFPLIVNLKGLEQANTITLAVLIQWLRCTPDTQGLHFKHVPIEMLKIIESCHLQNDLFFYR